MDSQIKIKVENKVAQADKIEPQVRIQTKEGQPGGLLSIQSKENFQKMLEKPI